ncbi:family 28 putative glycosyltransferase [Trichodelitschia bisporula]|uniref:UDP-N-acetylglucosamine transferase subunit ALG13 n=1 Tax=Trichodelitschia bisporula TaxID=703511 RepID=A0A6G1I7K5_9PEZI|nr:family 28 putative glycosyltransferase [Trichodelitschia bisporula]
MTSEFPLERRCFVTIGATAQFDDLVRAVLNPAFLCALQKSGFTSLRVQYGNSNDVFTKLLAQANEDLVDELKLDVVGFAFKESLKDDMLMARQKPEWRADGVVITHAGSGSILEALRVNAPIIVVPNPSLLDNHQVELAEALEGQGYVVHADLSNLEGALEAVDTLHKKNQQWPPVNSGVHRRARGLVGILDEESGYLD